MTKTQSITCPVKKSPDCITSMFGLVVLVVALLCCASPVEVMAQSLADQSAGGQGQAGASAGKGKGKPTIGKRPEVIGTLSISTDPTKPSAPTTAGSSQSPEVAQLITRFQTARNSYLESQKELRLKLLNATEEERALVREQIKEALAKWKEDQRQFVEEQKERVKELKQELHPDLSRVVDAAGSDAGDRRGR